MTLTSLTAPTEAPAPPARPAGLFSLSLASIGAVCGDIGTSPLYAFRAAMKAAGSTTRADVLGVLSLITWALMIVVTAKYVLILLRADNQGEGGTLSLLALAQRALGRTTPWVPALGVAGAALFFGDAVITPAISALSAVEGLSLATTAFEPYVLPITLGITLGLFLAQSHGTAAVARFFGLITLVWFIVLAVCGLHWIAQDPGVLAALSPLPAIGFAVSHGTLTFTVLGAVFLAVTGAEALYADLGHFGPNPIRLAWLGVALPALVLNYLGQGALVLARPDTLENPFFLMFPDAALLPIIALATAATIIASQAVISGAHSLTRQAVQLRLLPRMRMRHTSETPAAGDPGHGGLSDLDTGGGTLGAAAQPETLQVPARDERDPDRPVDARAPRCRNGPGRDAGPVAALPQSHAALRRHGRPERAAGAASVPQAGLAIRHHGDLVPSVAAHAETVGHQRHAGVATAAVPVPGAQCDRGVGLLPHPRRARGGNRHAGEPLKGQAGSTGRNDPFSATIESWTLAAAGASWPRVGSTMNHCRITGRRGPASSTRSPRRSSASQVCSEMKAIPKPAITDCLIDSLELISTSA
jgi:hypothetical protein